MVRTLPWKFLRQNITCIIDSYRIVHCINDSSPGSTEHAGSRFGIRRRGLASPTRLASLRSRSRVAGGWIVITTGGPRISVASK